MTSPLAPRFQNSPQRYFRFHAILCARKSSAFVADKFSKGTAFVRASPVVLDERELQRSMPIP